jgi:hypothetical protein
MVDYTTLVDHRHSIVAHVQIDLCSECQMFAIHPWSESSELDTNGLVEIGKSNVSAKHPLCSVAEHGMSGKP